MSRIPAFAIVMLAGLLPVCAAALSLGEIRAGSYLNQPLVAEIPVSSDVPGELAGLSVTVAPADTYAQFGLPRAAALADLRIAVVPGPAGGVIRLTSGQPIAEPFLTLLLELRWPQGRLLREFTVLLDPPDFATRTVPQPAVAPPRAEPPRPAVSAVAEPPVAESAATPRTSSAAVSPGGSERTHAVQRNETLWRIAERYRPDASTSINQMMVSIYRANPEAFAGNINILRAGAVLRIPDRAAVDALAESEARREVSRQDGEWRAGRAAAGQAPARLELVPPPESAATAESAARAREQQSEAAALRAELDESRRLLAIRDAELKALREQLGAVAQPPPRAAEAEIEAEFDEEADAGTVQPTQRPAETAAREQAARTAPSPGPPSQTSAKQEPAGIASLLQSVWLWGGLAAALAVVGGLMLARRRATAEESPDWSPSVRTGPVELGGAAATGAALPGADSMVVREEPARPAGRAERRQFTRGDDELPLERTISTDGPVNLDQSDPLAEADFHMAYGLYDQAADLLSAALSREPDRRDLHLKLLDVYFVWENRDQFLKEARVLRARLRDDDPDWKRVAIMGQQLCPGEALFAGGTSPGARDMDLAIPGESGGTSVDLDLVAGTGTLEFEADTGVEWQPSSSASGTVAAERATARTQEIPTIEAPGIDLGATRETPTIENPMLGSTIESPTLETPLGEGTMETPTIETWAPDAAGTARMRMPGALPEERADQTAEIDLEDLGLDLTGLDDVARDMATGLQEALPADAASLDFDLDEAEAGESTAEMEKFASLPHITNAMDKSEPGYARAASVVDDTIEQPGAVVGSGADSAGMAALSDDIEALNVDLDLGPGEPSELDLTATGLRAIGGTARAPEEPTMTEVGTKLDLARAYLDMGDPDGARSILNEVIEEGDSSQRQEARHLLDNLDS